MNNRPTFTAGEYHAVLKLVENRADVLATKNNLTAQEQQEYTDLINAAQILRYQREEDMS